MNSHRNRLPSLLTLITLLSLFCSSTFAVVLPLSVYPRALALRSAGGVSLPAAATTTTATITPVATFFKARADATSSAPHPSNTTSTDQAPGNINVQVWAPLVGIVAVIALLVLYTCFRKNSMNASMIAATRSANDAAASGGSSTGATNATRRRPRRTPSQVSTRSLPAYMMDPGEQEIVLARGRVRRNRSRPNMGDDMEDDDEYSDHDDDDMEMMDQEYGSNGRVSQADRPLLSASPTPGLVPPRTNRHSRSSTFDTIQMGSEDSQHRLLRDDNAENDTNDEHAGGVGGDGGMTYVFGDATTGGQLQVYDEHDREGGGGEEEHVEMSQLGGGVSVGSGSSGSSRQVSGFSSAVSPTRHAPSNSGGGGGGSGGGSGGVSGFFSSFSTLLTNSFTSIAHSISGMNAPMSGSAIGVGVAGGSSGGPVAYSSVAADQQQRALSPSRTRTDRRNRRQNTGGTVGSTNTTGTTASALLPPPYEGAAARSSTDTAPGQGRPSFGSSFAAATGSSSSTLSLQRQHTRNASSSNINNASAGISGSSSSLTISAPLAHTVTRSTFQYPASGPTTEQIKFLSSREALGKYGMPYGDEAVAAAQAAARGGASASATGGIEDLPPSFEDVTGSGAGSATVLSGSGQVTSSPTSTSTLSNNVVGTSTASPNTSTSVSSAPARSDSLASRISTRSTRNSVTGPRGPRNSLRKSTLTQSSSAVEKERQPRPSMDSMDSVDTVDSFGMEIRHKRRDTMTRDSGGGGDNGYWDAAAAAGVETQAQRDQQQQGQQEQQQQPDISIETQPQPRRSNLPKLTLEPVSPISPVLILSEDTSSSGILAFSSSSSTTTTTTTTAPIKQQQQQKQKPQIVPKTAPKGFVMSSPPPSPTPTTTSTLTHTRSVSYADSAAELAVPFITFAPATPSGEGDSVVGHESSRGFA